MIYKACKGLGTSERLLYPIICGRTNQEMELLKKKFFALYDKDLGQLLDRELGGDFEKLIFACLQANEEEYDEDYHTADKVEADTEAFYSMGEGKFGTDEGGFFKLICQSPPEHLNAVNNRYTDRYDVTLFKAVDDEMAGKTKEAAMFLLHMKLKPYEGVAELLHRACKGIGTNENLLTETVIRYQKHLKGIMEEFEKLTGKSLLNTLDTEVRGDYKKVLKTVCETAALS